MLPYWLPGLGVGKGMTIYGHWDVLGILEMF